MADLLIVPSELCLPHSSARYRFKKYIACSNASAAVGYLAHSLSVYPVAPVCQLGADASAAGAVAVLAAGGGRLLEEGGWRCCYTLWPQPARTLPHLLVDRSQLSLWRVAILPTLASRGWFIRWGTLSGVTSKAVGEGWDTGLVWWANFWWLPAASAVVLATAAVRWCQWWQNGGAGRWYIYIYACCLSTV